MFMLCISSIAFPHSFPEPPAINNHYLSHEQQSFKEIKTKTLFSLLITAMAKSYTILADLKAGRCSNTAEVRLLRFWEARNVKKGGELSFDILLLDENLSNLLIDFRPLYKDPLVPSVNSDLRTVSVKELSMHLSGFDVSRNNPNFRLYDESLSIRFNDGTSFDKLPESVSPIPTELFRFRSYNQLLELANTCKQLPVVIAFVSVFFYSMVLAFHSKFDSYGKEPRLVLATGVNPKIVGGRLFLNATSATHLYFDSETAVGK
ncbi:hypothetical protein HID58_028897 [Brassica napus]|uniref:Uncharacterized protein n=1 Tax=Brassica napus TaxID=3708 RepID=A0ABQ8CDK9_BRANA|nr:hypothetical protein HID58_028897 [Brassica napus]